MVSSDEQHRFHVVFRKGNEVRFLSHLDLMATIEYSMRRARLPLTLSEGFNPRPRMSLVSPLPVGYIGERELLEITLKENWPTDQVRSALQSALPAGLDIVGVILIGPGTKKAAARIASATYRAELPEPVPDLDVRVTTLLNETTLDVVEARESGTRTRNLRPLIRSVDALDESVLRLVVGLSEAGTIRPEQILTLMKLSTEGALVIRESIELSDASA